VAEKHYKGVTQLWAQSREAVRRNLGVFLFLNSLAILSVAWDTGTNLRDKVHGSDWKAVFTNTLGGNNGYPHVGGAFILVILAIAAVLLSLMSVVLIVHAAKKDKVTLAEVWEDFASKVFRLVGVELLTAFIILLGFLALILPGIYLIGRVILAPYILVDQDTKVFEAIEKSWHLTRDRMTQIYTVLLFTLLLSLPNIIPIIGPIIAFVLVLSFSVAMPMRYLELKHHRRSPAPKKA
jgi:uncharacterized membrane protein YesL